MKYNKLYLRSSNYIEKKKTLNEISDAVNSFLFARKVENIDMTASFHYESSNRLNPIKLAQRHRFTKTGM